MANMIIAGNTVIELSDEQMNTVLAVVRGLSASAIAKSVAPTSRSEVKSAPVAKTYEHASESFTDFMFVRKDNAITITHKDGKFLFEKAPRQALNARLKANGATYDKDAKAWVFLTKSGKRDIKGATEFVANHSNEVTADEINAIRDGWTEKSAKRASKATK